MGCIYWVVKKVARFVAFFFIVSLLPGIPPKTTFPFEAFKITPPRELTGPLSINYHLNNAEHLFEGRVYGPECLLSRGSDIYVSIHGGEIIKINGDHITHVAKFGKPCTETWQEAECGRPLGMAFDITGDNLIVADAYNGIWEINLQNLRKKQLVAPNEELDGLQVKRQARIFNSVAVSKSGDIYFTDSSSDFTIEDGLFSMFSNPSGRLFRHNRNTKTTNVLLDNLFFANGLALSPNEDFVIVAETGSSRIVKFHLTGPKKQVLETFVDGLPGAPDNLTPDSEGVWVPLVVSISAEEPALFQSGSEAPLIRKFLLRIIGIFETPFKLFEKIYPNTFCKQMIHWIGHFESVQAIHPKTVSVVRLDWNGNVIGSLHGLDGTLSGISHVLEFGEYLYLGSPFNRYIGRVKNPKPPQIKVKEVHRPTAKPTAQPTTTTTTPKPATTSKPVTTTTTPKPVTTTTTPKPVTTTTTPKPATTTTTPKPATTTTTPKPVTTTTTPKPITTTTPKPVTTTTPKPVTQPSSPVNVPEPAPIYERPEDLTPPPKEKLKVIKKGGAQGEL